jgi:hypothetical protein
MNCSEFESHLSEFVDGDISSQSRKHFLQHKDDCSTCGELLTDFKNALTAIHSLPNRTTSEDFDKRLFQKIHEVENPSLLDSIRGMFPDSLFPRYAIATAFVVMVAIFTYSGLQNDNMLTEPAQQSFIPPPSLNIQQPLASQQAITPEEAGIQQDTNDTSVTTERANPRSFEGRIQYVNGPGN